MSRLKMKIFSFLFILGLASCSSFPTNNIAPGYQEAFKTINSYFFGYDENLINKEIVQNIPYASATLKIGNGPKGLIILESKLGNKYTWVSADDIFLVVENGRIIQTAGLNNNLIKMVDPFGDQHFVEQSKEGENYKYYHSYDYPELNNLELNVNIL